METEDNPIKEEKLRSMKKKITKIWGVGLILMMVVSLLLWTAPAMAGNTMEWDDESVPDSDDYVILDGSDIVGLAVSAGGLAIYAVTGTNSYFYVSTDKGVTWDIAQCTDGTTPITPTFVAVTPDDPRYIAMANAGGDVYISDDGGATFDDLGDSSVDAVKSLAISRESGGNHFVAVSGVTSTATYIATYEIGAIGAGWNDMTDDGGFASAQGTQASAVAFSSNFHSDEILVAVTTGNASDTVDFQMYSYNQGNWNASAGFADYPFDILDGQDDSFSTLNKASIALSPDFLGSDDDLRIAFVGLATDTETDTSGIFRLEDDDVEALKDEKNINSVAFDGSNLLAGRYGDVDVYRSADPLASSPDVSGSKSYKHPSGETLVIVGWASDVAVAATTGDGSGFSVSLNDGKTFNGLSLIDTTLAVMTDVALSADGETLYLATFDNVTDDLSVWRLFDDDWERVFFDDSSNAANDYILRIAPDDPGVIFLADVGGSNIFYSTDSGDSRWYTRSSRYTIADLAVETTGEVLYVLVDGSCSVSKSTNTGFTWDSKQTSGLSGADSMIASLGEDMLIVGSAVGTVSYSTDGNDTWTDLEDSMSSTGLVQVTAQGLADGDFIFATTSTAADSVYRWELGEDDDWDDFFDMGAGIGAKGIALDSGGKILYVVSDNATDSILYRTEDATKTSPTFKDATEASVTFASVPSALRMTVGSNVLWAIDTANAVLYSLEDTMSVDVPIIRTPKAGFTVRVNPVSGNLNNVSLIWESTSDDVTEFDYEVAFDSDFDEVLISGSLTDTWDEGDTQAYEVSGASLMPNTTYYWRVRVDEPFRSGWAESSFKVAEAEGLPTVTVEAVPPPEITVEVPAPEVTVTIPPMVQVPAAPAPIAPGYIWGVIIIGALLFVSLIVLILRTRRVV